MLMPWKRQECVWNTAHTYRPLKLWVEGWSLLDSHHKVVHYRKRSVEVAVALVL